MHVVIIWQYDPKVKAILQPLIDKGADSGVVNIAGHHVRLFQTINQFFPRGIYVDRHLMLDAIISTASHALSENVRLAEMRVIFMFHQTNKSTVDAIMAALDMLGADILDSMAQAAQKDLKVRDCILLSCESASDKTAPNPVPDKMKKWVNQARDMRTKAIKAFTVKKVSGPGEYYPQIVTFSTGNPETGGVVLNPWKTAFIRLNGHFTPGGGWEYDTDANGQPDKTQTPSSGKIYIDTGQPGGSGVQPFPAGQGPSFMPFNPQDI